MKIKQTSHMRRFNFLLVGINILILMEHHWGRRLYPVNTPGKEFIWLILPMLLGLSLFLNLFTVKLITTSGENRLLLQESAALRPDAGKRYFIICAANLTVSGATLFSMLDAEKYVLAWIPVLKALLVLLALACFPRRSGDA